MTIQEASERYQIPMEVLRTYERWGLCPEAGQAAGERRYDGRDLERLSLILTLRDIGFTGEETERYMLERPGTEGSGCGCWRRNGPPRWRISTPGSGRWSAWTTCAISSGSGRRHAGNERRQNIHTGAGARSAPHS